MLFNKYLTGRLCFSPDDGGGSGGGAAGDSGNGSGGAGTVELPKSAEELSKLLAAETEKAILAAQSKWNTDFGSKIEAEKAEAVRIAKLSAEEREKELEKKRKEELDQREATIKGHELTIKATDMLTAKGLPLDIRSLVIGKDEADTQAKIEAFEGVFQKAVETAVNAKLSNSARPSGSSSDTKSYEDMTMEELQAKLYKK